MKFSPHMKASPDVISQARTLRRELRKVTATNDDLIDTLGALNDALGPLLDRFPQDACDGDRARWADEIHAALTTTSREE
jgi:hypothetical protein